jgi:hypothetical protein
VPGDDATVTVITHGVPWDIRSSTGRAIFRAVGTLVEPPGEVGTFTGHTTVDGVTTRYDDAPLSQVLPDDAFVDYVCRAVTTRCGPGRFAPAAAAAEGAFLPMTGRRVAALLRGHLATGRSPRGR